MSVLDKDVYLRNHVVGVLASFSGKTLNNETIDDLGASLTQAVIDAELRWNKRKCCTEIKALSHNFGRVFQ